MRLLYTTNQPVQGRTLSRFLTNEGIENQLDMTKNSDWGSDSYGDALTRVWVIDEDSFDKAREWADLFELDPNNPIFHKNGAKPIVYPTVIPSENDSKDPNKAKPKVDFLRDLKNKRAGAQQGNGSLKAEPPSSITTGLVILCCIIYLISAFTTPHLTELPAGLPYTPLTSSPIHKQMLYDYPKAYSLVDRLVNLYGVEALLSPDTLPPEGKIILSEVNKTPTWGGFYDLLVKKLQTGTMPPVEAPLFEKIREGEVWRLFTPCLLHSDILHLLFNMIWLLVLGKQIEQRLNSRRFMFLMIVIGILSNTCQYFMSGPNFIGFSGIVCGLLAFIWIRQKVAPWEGYPLNQSTINFLFYFIIAMLGLQLVSFSMEVSSNSSFTPGIANTAHFAGAIVGAILARFSFFSWKANPYSRPKNER